MIPTQNLAGISCASKQVLGSVSATETKWLPPERLHVLALIGLWVAIIITAGCNRPPVKPGPTPTPQAVLYVGSTAVPAIQFFGLPALRPGRSIPVASGPPLAMRAAGPGLYVATGGRSVVQYRIDSTTGDLSLLGTAPLGDPPYSMTATETTLYVANRGSQSVSVFSIAPDGRLTSVQTLPNVGASGVQVDEAGRFLIVAGGPGIWMFAIQPGGTLATAPADTKTIFGTAQEIVYRRGTLYLLSSQPVGGGTSFEISAWVVDAAAGTVALRGTYLRLGQANASGLAASVDGRFLFLARQGGFLTLNTADPLQIIVSVPPVPAVPPVPQPCVWPPASAGAVVADPRGGGIYLSDPVGSATGPPQGPRVSSLIIGAGGDLRPSTCAQAADKPIAMEVFVSPRLFPRGP